jgi:hypothetical protein
VGGGYSEQSDHRIPDELLHHAAVGLDLSTGHLGVGGEHLVDVLGIRGLGGRGEPDEVAEQAGDDLAFLGDGANGSRIERSSALHAELRPVGVLVAAVRAVEHVRCYPARDTERAPSRRPAWWADPFIKSGNVLGNIPHLDNLKLPVMGDLIRTMVECYGSLLCNVSGLRARLVKHEDEGASPKMAKRLEAMLGTGGHETEGAG